LLLRQAGDVLPDYTCNPAREKRRRTARAGVLTRLARSLYNLACPCPTADFA
jgi:hypothetical protein